MAAICLLCDLITGCFATEATKQCFIQRRGSCKLAIKSNQFVWQYSSYGPFENFCEFLCLLNKQMTYGTICSPNIDGFCVWDHYSLPRAKDLPRDPLSVRCPGTQNITQGMMLLGITGSLIRRVALFFFYCFIVMLFFFIVTPTMNVSGGLDSDCNFRMGTSVGYPSNRSKDHIPV